MWIFIAVGVIPFVIVFGIFNTIHARIAYSKTKEAIFNVVTNAQEKVENAKKTCAYCGSRFEGEVCPSCGAGVAKK